MIGLGKTLTEVNESAFRGASQHQNGNVTALRALCWMSSYRDQYILGETFAAKFSSGPMPNQPIKDRKFAGLGR